ncbi:MAG TPA: 4Fe-4S binding protein [Plasticicumulans sp.]|uniref:4Fe-4S binding protein n=1 Tax=Plasticicumulans sp. TaxID=2307179 RepID=UPI002B524ECC|nr:4Fe-4S binding protein [Plasticicumulans sp.]HMW29551.1 4Fe-4S binding protein [Plasticicumulans sp.]
MPDPDPSSAITSADARAQALAAAAAVAVTPTSTVDFVSQGRVLILGPGTAALTAAGRLCTTLQVVVLASGPAAVPVPAGVTLLYREQRRLTLDGQLGGFFATLDADGRSFDLGERIDAQRPVFDLVLDLGDEPAFRREWGPLGYYRPLDAEALEAALAELPELCGEFEKPKFFAYDASICAHGQAGLDGCRRCIEACPAEAIESLLDRVRVNPNLCQGGGACASACPSGAIVYRYPPAADTLLRLRKLLTTYRRAAGGERPVLVFMDEHAGIDPLAWPGRVLPVLLAETASAGMDLWLGALAYGAAAVRVLRAPDLAPKLERALDEQLGFARAILAGLGWPAEALGWLAVDGDPLTGAEMPAMPAAGYAGSEAKRERLWAAIDHLHAHAPQPAEVLALPQGAPFGQILVNPETCTLCMACVSVCAPKALADGGEEPKLRFVEAACVQCGLCETACPEHAIERETRLLLPFEQRRRQRTLHEDQPHHCPQCGKAFATQSMIRTITGRLAHHPMFAGDGLRRLLLCEDCRVRDLYRSEGLGQRPGP